MGIFRRNQTPVASPPATSGTYRVEVTAPPPAIPIPVASTLPTIEATRKVGEIFTVTPATWNVATPDSTYQWYRSGVAISGANNSTYVAVTADIGTTITVRETKTNESGTATATSAGSTVTSAVATLPSVITPPSISFAQPAALGSTLTRVSGVYADADSYSGQWTRDNVNIPGATGATYTIVTADLDKLIRFVETATNANGSISVETQAVGPTVPDTNTTSALRTLIFSTGPTGFNIYRSMTGATSRNSSGEIIVAGPDTPRYHHDEAGQFEGVYMEKYRANRCSHNTQLGLTPLWTLGSGVTVTLNAATAPDGSSTATRLQISAGTAYRGIVRGVTGTSGSLRHSIYGRSRTGAPRTMIVRHPANGYQEVTFGTTWTRIDLIGVNEGGNNFNMNILVNDTGSADVEIWGEDVTQNGLATDSIIITTSAGELARNPEFMTIDCTGLSPGVKDVLFTFNDGTTQNVAGQSISNNLITISADVLNKTLVRQVAIYNPGAIPASPPPAPPPPPPPPAPPPSGALYDTEKIIDAMTGPNDNLYYMETAPNTGEQIGSDKHYTYIAVGRNRSDGQSHWPGEYISDGSVTDGYGVKRSVVTSNLKLLPWYVYGRRAGAAGNSTNTRLQIRNARLYTLGSDNVWTLRASNNGNLFAGSSWHANFRSPGNETYEDPTYGSGTYQIRDESSNGGGYSIGGVGQGDRRAWAIHGFPISYSNSNTFWTGLKGVLWVHEARLILHNPAGTDDRADSGILAWIGADWYPNDKWLQEIGHSRLRLVTNDWDIYPLSDAFPSILRANKPPGFS